MIEKCLVTTVFSLLQLLLLMDSTVLFEEVSFKANFEGREGRAVTERKRKRIPDVESKEAKGTTTMLFSFEQGDAKYSIIRRRAQRPRRDVDVDKYRGAVPVMIR